MPNLLRSRVSEIIEKHGSVRAAASVLGVSYPYLYRLSTGERTDPSDDILKKLKLRKVVTYTDTKAARK